jgi:cyanate permease
MFAIGYLCAFVVPIIGGTLWDLTGSAPAAFGPILLFALLAVFLAARLDFLNRGQTPIINSR